MDDETKNTFNKILDEISSIKEDITVIKTKLDIGEFNKRIAKLELYNANQTGKITIICVAVGIAVNFILTFLMKRI
jgi:hypothetical protein